MQHIIIVVVIFKHYNSNITTTTTTTTTTTSTTTVLDVPSPGARVGHVLALPGHLPSEVLSQHIVQYVLCL